LGAANGQVGRSTRPSGLGGLEGPAEIGTDTVSTRNPLVNDATLHGTDVLTTLVPFSAGEADEWLATFADPVRAQAAIDRFTSNAYDLVIEGESYRKRLKPKSPAGKPG
jgi:hypothetical protein